MHAQAKMSGMSNVPDITQDQLRQASEHMARMSPEDMARAAEMAQGPAGRSAGGTPALLCTCIGGHVSVFWEIWILHLKQPKCPESALKCIVCAQEQLQLGPAAILPSLPAAGLLQCPSLPQLQQSPARYRRQMTKNYIPTLRVPWNASRVHRRRRNYSRTWQLYRSASQQQYHCSVSVDPCCCRPWILDTFLKHAQAQCLLDPQN